MAQIIPFSDLKKIKPKKGKAVVLCHGCFDILHIGHINYLKSAKALGDMLVVTVTADRHINKGPGRPVFPAPVRAEMLAQLNFVDFVAISDHKTAIPAIEALKPSFYVKGPDYRDRTKDLTGEIYREEAAIEAVGGAIAFTDDDTYSSSTLANRFFVNRTDEQEAVISRVKAAGGFVRIIELFEAIEQMTVSVVGEPIIDTYRFVEPQNISSKSPSISAAFLYEENYCGGSLAIANHLADFVKKVEVTFTHGGERFARDLFAKCDKRVGLNAVIVPVPTPRKTRYISVDKSQRIFEVTELRSDQWVEGDPAVFLGDLERAKASDLMIVADFGHGLFEGEVLKRLAHPFLALNVQTNSSNFGFNPFTKHAHCDYLCLDVREARVAFHDRRSSPEALSRGIPFKHALTLGKNGAIFHDGEEAYLHSPAFCDEVVDATGAGDAFFGITSLLVKAGAEAEIVPFVGNVFAGLKAKIVGNKSSVGKTQLMKAIAGILK